MITNQVVAVQELAKNAYDAESLSGRECYRLTTKWGGDDQELWVDRAAFLLQRPQGQHEGKAVEAVITYDPKIDGDVPAGILRFDPPK